jgi:hypothetical protein
LLPVLSPKEKQKMVGPHQIVLAIPVRFWMDVFEVSFFFGFFFFTNTF